MGLYSRAVVLTRRITGVLASRKLSKYGELRRVLVEYSNSKSAAVDAADSVALYEAVRKRFPQRVLELGPGTSTAVIASALQPGATLTAIEESPEWLACHVRDLPPHLSGVVTMLHSDVSVTDEYGPKAAFFTHIPDGPYDFVHIDGPGHFTYGCDVTCDILRVALAPECMIVFDGRQASARLAKPHLERLGFTMRWNIYSMNREFVR